MDFIQDKLFWVFFTTMRPSNDINVLDRFVHGFLLEKKFGRLVV